MIWSQYIPVYEQCHFKLTLLPWLWIHIQVGRYMDHLNVKHRERMSKEQRYKSELNNHCSHEQSTINERDQTWTDSLRVYNPMLYKLTYTSRKLLKNRKKSYMIFKHNINTFKTHTQQMMNKSNIMAWAKNYHSHSLSSSPMYDTWQLNQDNTK